MNIQLDKNQRKLQNLKPFQDLYLRLSFNRQQPEIIPYPLSSDILDDKNTNLLTIKVETILKIASSLIIKKKIKLNKFMNIFVEIDHKLVNVFKLKKGLFGQSEGNIFKIKRQDQSFYLNLWIFDLQKIEKTNPLLELTTQNVKYQKIMQKLEQIHEVFTKQIQNLNDEQKSSYDIAYFFAQPLVEPQKIQDFPVKTPIYQNLKLEKYRASGSDVSFQKQYDKFINVIKAQNFCSNITIEMMVATENNIRQVLSERCNILHFSCHGQVEYLKIEKDRNVGYLDALTSARLIKLLDGKALPKIIIFNACHSRKIAADVHERFPQITTVGYEGKADDNYCQILTQRLYQGIYGRRKQPFFKLFEEVKSQIASKNEQQAKKLYIFKASTQFKFDKSDFPVNHNYNINWGYFENLGKKQPIGIKLKLFEFIKNYLLNSQKTKIFVLGQPESGKSVFIKKALYYTMHRCVFRQKLYIDLRKGEKSIVNMLELKLQYKKQIYNFIKENKTTNFIIIVDHCNDLIRNDPEEFMKFFKKVQRQIKLGKLILVCDNISYFMEINILIDENVYEYQEIIPAKEPKIRDDYNTYMNRWHQNLDKNWNEFLKHRIGEWFEALRPSDTKEAFTQNLQKIKKKDQDKQAEKLMVNLELQFERFRYKILRTQRKIKAYLTSWYYSRSLQCFIMVNIFPQFKPTQKEQISELAKLQRRQKHSYIQELTVCYEQDIKNIINQIIEALGKFHTQTYGKSWWENQLLFVAQKLFVIIGLAILVKDSKQGEKQVEKQLFNAYTLIMKLFNRYQKLLSELPRLMAQCQALKLKIYMGMYNFYKHHELLRVAKEKVKNSENYQKAKSEISSINAVEVGFNINFLQTIQVQDGFKDSLKENNNIADSGNASQFGFVISQRDSLTNNYVNRDRRDSIRSQNDFSSLRPSIYPTNHVSYDREAQQKKQSTFKDFQVQLKEQYGQSQYWQLIQKVTELDTIIRAILSQQSKELVIDPASIAYTGTVMDFSSSQNQRVFETYYSKVDKFYRLYDQVIILYERLESSYGLEESYDTEVCGIRKVFFGQVQLDFCYLQGLKIVAKLIQVINDEYFFDYEVWYKAKLNNIREKLIKTQKILEYSIARKLNHNRDLSYKKVYKQYLQLYIDLRFKLQKFYSSYTPNGQKKLLQIFNKLLKLSDDARSIQLKNRIHQFIEKKFYNKCSVLISQPIGYIPKHKNFSFNYTKDNKKAKGSIKKQSSYEGEKILFYPLNIFRTSDMIVNQIKNATEKKVVSQINIETQILNFERLSSNSSEKTQEDERKKRLIYLIMCDCKKSARNQSFFIENERGESIKKYFKGKSCEGFPYAPVIILYGSNVDLLQSYYRQYAENEQKKIAIIMLPVSDKIPEMQSDNMKEMLKLVWNQYLQKHIGVSFLSSFWTKFCQTYFDEEHECFRNQVIRSFNIAKQESLILLKKKYLEGLNGSSIQKEIDSILSRLSLRIENKYESNEAVNLQNKLKCNLDKQPQNTLGSTNIMSREDQLLRTSTIYQSPKKQDQIIALNNHQIGCNYQIHQFMKEFFQNIQNFQKDKQFTKNFIQYHSQITETNLITFAKTLYHKFLRMGNKFQAGVQFRNMQGVRFDNNNYNYNNYKNNEIFNLFHETSTTSTFVGSMALGNWLQIKEEDSVDYQSCASEEVVIKKQKRVEIYYNIAYKDLKPLIQGFKSKDQSSSSTTNSFFTQQSPKTLPTTTFRILIVDTSFIDHDMKYYLQSSHSCRINNHQIRHSYLENMYHACDAILHYSKRFEGFSFARVIDEIYNKKNPVENLKNLSPRQVKDKIVEYFQKHYH